MSMALRLCANVYQAGNDNQWGKIGQEAEWESGSALPMVYMACEMADQNRAGYEILDGMADSLLSVSLARNR